MLDSDQAGRDLKATLASGLYKPAPKKLITVGEFTKVPDAEVEDLIPVGVLEPLLDKKLFRDAPDLFTDHYDPTLPLVGQLEAFAARHGITLEDGWKVTLAKGFKNRLLAKSPPTIDKDVAAGWKKLFTRIMAG